MAVARITATRSWHLKTAEVIRDLPRASRELQRAANRRGLTAELRADELRALVELKPKDKRVQKAFEELQAAEAYEAARPRARDIALGLVRWERGKY